MSVQELLDWCAANNVPLSTHIVIADKDDHLLIADNVKIEDNPYFGNCRNGGDALLDEMSPVDEETCERQNEVMFLILGTGY